MSLKSDAKFEEKLTLGSKSYMRNLVNFYQTIQKSENFTSMDYFCPKYLRFEPKKYKGVINSDVTFEQTLTSCFQKWHEKLGELSLNHSKV